jgi:hypothetical protein
MTFDISTKQVAATRALYCIFGNEQVNFSVGSSVSKCHTVSTYDIYSPDHAPVMISFVPLEAFVGMGPTVFCPRSVCPLSAFESTDNNLLKDKSYNNVGFNGYKSLHVELL